MVFNLYLCLLGEKTLCLPLLKDSTCDKREQEGTGLSKVTGLLHSTKHTLQKTFSLTAYHFCAKGDLYKNNMKKQVWTHWFSHVNSESQCQSCLGQQCESSGLPSPGSQNEETFFLDFLSLFCLPSPQIQTIPLFKHTVTDTSLALSLIRLLYFFQITLFSLSANRIQT